MGVRFCCSPGDDRARLEMEILENIQEKMENIWKIFESAMKGIEGDLVKKVQPVLQPRSTSLLLENKENKGSHGCFSQKPPSSHSQWRGGALLSEKGELGIVLPQHPVPRENIEDFLWSSHPAQGYLCDKCGLVRVGAITCHCSHHLHHLQQPQSKRWDLKKLIKSLMRGRGEEQADTEQRRILAGADEDQRTRSEEDMKKALRKVLKKNMTRHEACQLYGIPYQDFVDFERKVVIDKNNKKSSNLKRKSSDILYDSNDKSSLKVDAGGGEWARMLMEELEETVWLRPVKRIKLEKTIII